MYCNSSRILSLSIDGSFCPTNGDPAFDNHAIKKIKNVSFGDYMKVYIYIYIYICIVCTLIFVNAMKVSNPKSRGFHHIYTEISFFLP